MEMQDDIYQFSYMIGVLLWVNLINIGFEQRKISNFSNLSFRSRFTTRKQTRKRDKKKDRKRAQYINESNTSVPQARLLTRESKGNQQQSIIMASTLTCRGCRVSIGTKVIPEFMGIGILSLSSYLLWCCGVVVLWCCGVVVLWCCGVIGVYVC